MIEIARQARPSLYDPFADRPEPLVPRALRFEVDGRLDASGHELEPVEPSTIPRIPDDVDAVAVCLLHADLNPVHEQVVAHALRAQGLDVTCSHEVSPEFREYERIVTTVANAALRPRCRPYLLGIGAVADSVLVMTSAGGLLPVGVAADLPVALLLSGPAGGVRAAAAVAGACGFPDAVSFDMGGTSTDVCLIRGGTPEPAPMHEVAGLPVRYPALDIHTIGAGGGSIARLDPGGALVVGPQSAGAMPGPACYGLGGTAPTVTDADLVLGRIPAGAAFAGLGALRSRRGPLGPRRRGDLCRRGRAGGRRGDGTRGARRDRRARGRRPWPGARGVRRRRTFARLRDRGRTRHGCGDRSGAGGRALRGRAGLRTAATRAGAFLARLPPITVGSPRPGRRWGSKRRSSTEWATPRPCETETFLDCRYAGQSHEITVAEIEEFPAEHERRNGYARPGVPIEVVAIRARARGPVALDPADLPEPVPARVRVVGPAVASEPDCTVWVPAGWVADPGPTGAWILTRGAESA